MGKVALVTGANRGLGFEVARRLAESGVTVLVAGRDRERAAKAADALAGSGLTAEPIELDVRDVENVRAAAARICERHGVVDILVNNAGILPEATSEAQEAVDGSLFRETFETNLLGAVNVTEHLLPLLRASPAGRIVNVSTTMGSLSDQSNPSSPYYGTVVPAYQASKAALNSVTISLAKSLTGTPIKVNAVCPGFVQTDLTPINREHAPLTAGDAATVVVDYALLPDDGVTDGFFDRDSAVAW